MRKQHNETLALRALLPAVFAAAKLPNMADTIAGYDEMQGYDETVGNYPEVGAWYNPLSWFHHGGGAPRPPQGPPPGFMPYQPPRPRLPGAPQLPPGAVQALQSGPRRLLAYMGLGTASWVSTDTETEKQLIAEPQAAFRGRRLVIDVAKTTGAASILTTITSPLTVSGMPQTPAPSEPAPTSMFQASATYSMLDLQIATSATQIAMGVSVSAIPASGESVVISAGLYGEWLR